MDSPLPFHGLSVHFSSIGIGIQHELCHIPVTIRSEVLDVDVRAVDVEVRMIVAVLRIRGVDRIGILICVRHPVDSEEVGDVGLSEALYLLSVGCDQRVLFDVPDVILIRCECELIGL